MIPSVLQRLDSWTRRAAPVATSLAIVVLSVMPIRLPDYALLAPGAVLMAVFYWTVHRPDLMRPWAAFLVGLFDDILSGAPIGLNALVFVLVHGVIVSRHRLFLGLSFALVWFAFAVIAAGAMTLGASIGWAVGGAAVDPGALALRYGLAVAMYPLAGWFLGRAQRAFLPAR